jgi:Fic family protein
MMTADTFTAILELVKQAGILEAVNYTQMNEALISHHSTAIEGSSLTEEETRLFLTEGLTAKGKTLYEHNMIKDHHQALLYVVETAKANLSVSSVMIQHISALVMKNTGSEIHAAAGTYDSSKGDFRKSAVYVGTRYFSNYQKVPGETEKLCAKINERLNAVRTTAEIYDLAFDAHFDLVSIHPLADGNGRVSRLLMNYILAFHSQPLAILFHEDRADYYKALEDARKNSCMQPFRDFMYRQQIHYFTRELEKLEASKS